MKIKLHDKNETIIELDIIIYAEKGIDSIFIQSENHSFTLDYEDIKEDYESEKTTLERDYELIYDSICTNVEELKALNEALEKSLENNKNSYLQLHNIYINLNASCNEYDEKINNIRKYILEKRFINKKELLELL